MISPTYNSFSLQDTNYITSEVNYRTTPKRDIVLETIARKPGRKILSTEFGPREISLSGFILGTDVTDLKTRVDNFNSNVTQDTMGTLILETGREIQAIVDQVNIPDPFYTQAMVPFSVKFVCPDPFFYGAQQTATTTVTSGSTQPRTQTITTTISGTIFAEPVIAYNAPGTTGNTTTSGIILEYEPTGQTTTWSGGGDTLSYGNFVRFDYENQLILEGSTEIEAGGVFPRWEPGSTSFTMTFSGGVQGGTVDLIYRPRYL